MNLGKHASPTCFLLFLIVYTPTMAFAICAEYTHYTDIEIEKYMNILQNSEKSETSRTLAYDKISCSDSPIYRQYSLEIGLQDTSNSILRSKILLDIMMDKDIFVINLIDSPNLNKESKNYIKRNNDQIRFKAYQRDPVKGCITIYINSKCGSDRQIKVIGKFVEITYVRFYGKFELTSNNHLEGYVIYSANQKKTEKIPAKLILF